MSLDNRSYPRKVMRCPAQLQMASGGIVRCRTIDLSLSGASVMVADQLAPGSICTFNLDAPFNGQTRRVVAKVKVVYSILSGTDGFRTGLGIVEIDSANNKALAELML